MFSVVFDKQKHSCYRNFHDFFLCAALKSPISGPLHQLRGKSFMKNIKMKLARVAKDMSQEQLALQVGATRQTILMIESGKYNPSLNLCRQICRALGVTLNDIFWEADNNE